MRMQIYAHKIQDMRAKNAPYGFCLLFTVYHDIQWHAKVWEPLADSVKMLIILTK